MIVPRITSNQQIVDTLYALVNENTINPAISVSEQQLMTQVDMFIGPCMSIYQAVIDANANNSIPADLSAQYDQCNLQLDALKPYLTDQ
jgi:polyhydroxyalkanoate synthesis regulator protein